MDKTRVKKAVNRALGTFSQVIGVPATEKYKPAFEWKPRIKNKKLHLNFKWNDI